MQAGQRLIGVILLHQRGGAGVEIGAVLLGPPVLEHALAVIFAALVVEAMADLMADHRADGAVIHRIIGVGIEEGRLQDGGRETRSR